MIIEVLVSVIVALTATLVGVILLYFKNKKKLLTTVVQVYADKMILQDEVRKLRSEKELNDKNTEFVRFLSESRESAFSYIEDVQLAIKNLREAMGGEDQHKITAAYNTILSFLPNDDADMVK